MIDYDIDGMDDTKWHNFNTSEDVIRLPEFEACASAQPKTCRNQQSENNSKYNCVVDFAFNSLGYFGYGTACGAEYNKHEKVKWSLLEKKYQDYPIPNSANKKKIEYALRYKWLYKTNLVLGIASTAFYGHQSYENPTFENNFDLSVSVISLMGTYGTAAAAIIETYRPAVNALIEITNKINTKGKSLNDWFEFYKFGFYW